MLLPKGSTGSDTRLYFAYGSNMGNAQMSQRCPGHSNLGQAILTGYRWIIALDGYANVVPSPGDMVAGVLYRINRDDEKVLDHFEGVHAGDYEKRMLVVSQSRQTVEALVYINSQTGTGRPSAEYTNRLHQAFADAPPGQHYIDRYITPFLEQGLA